jgi:hypothetical protein
MLAWLGMGQILIFRLVLEVFCFHPLVASSFFHYSTLLGRSLSADRRSWIGSQLVIFFFGFGIEVGL